MLRLCQRPDKSTPAVLESSVTVLKTARPLITSTPPPVPEERLLLIVELSNRITPPVERAPPPSPTKPLAPLPVMDELLTNNTSTVVEDSSTAFVEAISTGEVSGNQYVGKEHG